MLPDIKKMITYASMAPSGHNTQPWKFQTEGHYIKLLPDYSKTLPVADADHHELFISLGCALENLVLAAKELGYNGNVMYDMTDGEEEILIHLYEDETITKDILFASIADRHVNRSHYLDQEIPAEVLEQLEYLSKTEGVTLSMIHEKEEKKSVAALLKKAAFMQFSNKEYKSELLHWIRFSQQEALQYKDGLRAASNGNPSMQPWLGSFFFQHFVTPAHEAKKAEHLAEESPVLVVFTVKQNSKKSWVEMGRCFERFSLAATRYGIAHAHLNMACQEKEMREQLKGLLHTNEEPLLLLRIGFSNKELPPSYRLPVDTLVTDHL